MSSVLRFWLFLPLAAVTASAANENLFKNSDVSSSSAWEGDRKFDKDGENKVLRLVARSKDAQSFAQDANLGDTKDVILVFRYKTSDYKGRGLQLRGRRPDGSSTFRNLDLKVNGEWTEYRWPFSEIRGAKKMTFSITLLEGDGSVLFDDIQLLKK